MTEAGGRDFDFMRILLDNAQLHFKLVFGLTATKLQVKYLDQFAFGAHTAAREELTLTAAEEEHAFSALEHCATYLSAVQVHMVLERLHAPNHFNIREPEIADAFQIARLIRNAFAHNPFGPVWDVRGTWRDRVFVVPGVIRLDTTGLDARPVRREDYGGPLAILRFIEYAETVVDAREREQPA